MPGQFFVTGITGIKIPAALESDCDNIERGMIVLATGLVIQQQAFEHIAMLRKYRFCRNYHSD